MLREGAGIPRIRFAHPWGVGGGGLMRGRLLDHGGAPPAILFGEARDGQLGRKGIVW